jgi:hypothetical protein
MSIYACSVCFWGAPEDPMNISLRAAIMFMLSVLLIVFSFFIKFFIGVSQRSKLAP